MGYVAFDLDGTLAKYHGWEGPDQIGEPIQPMIDVLQTYLDAGEEVRIITARASLKNEPHDLHLFYEAVEAWLLRHVGRSLQVQAEKDFGMRCLYDDRAKQVVTNEGVVLEDRLKEAEEEIARLNEELKKRDDQLKDMRYQ